MFKEKKEPWRPDWRIIRKLLNPMYLFQKQESGIRDWNAFLPTKNVFPCIHLHILRRGIPATFRENRECQNYYEMFDCY